MYTRLSMTGFLVVKFQSAHNIISFT